MLRYLMKPFEEGLLINQEVSEIADPSQGRQHPRAVLKYSEGGLAFPHSLEKVNHG